MLQLFLPFSVLVDIPKKLLETVAKLARGLLQQGKKKKSGSESTDCSYGEILYPF